MLLGQSFGVVGLASFDCFMARHDILLWLRPESTTQIPYWQSGIVLIVLLIGIGVTGGLGRR